MNIIRQALLIAAAGILVMGAGHYPHTQIALASAQDDWRAEFDDICSKTTDAMSLPKDEIKKLVERCDALKPRIEKLDESAAKVYLKRLQRCRSLFVFVLESPPR